LTKWGVVYLVVWSDCSKKYFSSFNELFDVYWQDNAWSIFRYTRADGRSVTMNTGEGWIAEESYFSKKIELRNVVKGETIVVRSNYFPTWKAFVDGVVIPTSNIGGQLGLTAPRDGSYSITLQFPKYRLFSILAVIILLMAGIASSNRKFTSLLAR
jgi:hypothetical protein